MKSCWSLKPSGRPKFQDLVVMFSSLLERSAGYLDLLDLSQSLRWKENPKASLLPPSPPLNAFPDIQEQEAEDDHDEF